MPLPIRVDDVMSHPVRTTGPATTASEAAARCSDEGIGSLVVADDDGPVGIVTTTDLVACLDGDTDPRDRPVEEFMSSPVVTVEAGASVEEAVTTMLDRDISRVVVLDDGTVAGIVTTSDVLRYVPQVLHRRQFDSSPGATLDYRVRKETAYERSDWEFECRCVTDDAVSVGDRVTFAKTISEADVRTFADASGDTNRLHLDEAFAAETRFGRRIVHGTLVGGLISAALARLPGLTIYLSQDLSFLAPVDVGDRATAVCEVVDEFGRNKYQLTTDVFSEGEAVIEGEAAVLIDPSMPEAVAREPIE